MLHVYVPVRLMSGRRRFLAIAGVPFASALAFGESKSAERVWRIGVLHSTPIDAESWEVFSKELRRRGYVTGRNLTFVKRQGNASESKSLDEAARELVDLKVDLIYAYPGSSSALAAQRATATVPIVFHSSADPIGLGLVQSLARPGKNVTGNYNPNVDVEPKRLQLLREAAGRLLKVAYLHSGNVRSLAGHAATVAAAESAARTLGIGVLHVDIGDDIEPTLRELVRQHVDGVAITGHGYGFDAAYLQRLAAALIASRLPSIGFADLGFLVYYGSSDEALEVAAARYVDELLKGANPGRTPVEQVSKFELQINLRTATALGLQIPRSVLVQATYIVR